MRKLLLIYLLCFIQISINAGTLHEIKGIVVDGSNTPIDSVEISINLNNEKYFTNIDGKFKLNSISEEGVLLSFKHPLFISISKKIIPGDTVIVTLNKNVTLSEVSISARRNEDIHSKAPISVHTFSKLSIERNEINSLDRVEQFSPSFTFDQLGFSKSRVAIRGLGSDNTTLGQDFSSSVFLNGMHMNTTGLAKIEVFDMERIEVFRGSHSSKWGKNVIGGGINFISTKPKKYNYSKISIGVASFDEFSLEAMNNHILSNKIIQRTALSLKKSNGYSLNKAIDRKIDDFREFGFRNTISFITSEKLSFDLISDYSYFNSNGNAYALLGGNENGKRSRVWNYLSQNRDFDSREVTTEERGIAKKIVYGTLLNLRYHHSKFDLEFNSGFRNIKDDYFNNQIGFSDDEILHAADKLDDRAANYSIGIADSLIVKYAELRGSKEFGFGKIGFGAFLNNESGNSKSRFISRLIEGRNVGSNSNYVEGYANGFGAIILEPNVDVWNIKVKATDYALFNFYHFEFLNKLKTDISIRYSVNKKEFVSNTLESKNSLISGEAKVIDSSHSWENFSWNVDFSYDVTEKSILYLLVGTGFKPGGYSSFVSSEIIGTPLESETSLSYEFGYKNKFNDNIYGTLNLYHARYEGLQTIQFTDNGIFATNAEETKLKGFEIELDFIFDKLFNSRISYSYLDSEVNGYQDLYGLKLQRAPQHEAVVFLNKNIGKISIGSVTSYRSEVFDDPDNDLGEVRPSRILWDVNLEYKFPKNFSVKLYAKNLLNEVYYLRTTNSYDARVATLGNPRIFGVKITKLVL